MTFRDQDSRSRLEVQVRGETKTRLLKMRLEIVSRPETGLENSITTRAPWINIIVNYCCTRVLLYAKMLKETEETIVVFVIFLSLVAFQLVGGPGYA